MGKNLLAFLYAACLFVYLATPALLVIGPVQRTFGLSWAASIFCLTAFILTVWQRRAVPRLAVILVVSVFAALNVALSISFLVQGASFNTAFFTHLDLSTLQMAWATDHVRLSLALLYVLLAPIVSMWCATNWALHAPDRLTRVPIVIGTLVIAVVTSYPLQSIALHYHLTQKSSERMLAEIQSLSTRNAARSSSNSADRNLVLIYLEGVEQNYLDDTLFPGLMPRLVDVRSNALWFDNIHQFPGTGWTIAGLVSSQCGVPLLSDGHGNRILEAVDNPFRQIPCLAEFLQEDGYDTIYLGGATLGFAGKGHFLGDNGYRLTLGIDELPKAARHSWGMFDEDLFDHGREIFDALAAGNTPFLLTLLTLDTHHPNGTPSPSCPLYADPRETMLNAVHCADHLVTDFIEHIQSSSVAENTVIALVSDHLLMYGAPLEVLRSKERRITFMLLDPSREPARYSGPATHFDIAPTLLDAIGRSDATFPFGHSLLRHEEGRAFARQLTEVDFQGFKIERLVEGTH